MSGTHHKGPKAPATAAYEQLPWIRVSDVIEPSQALKHIAAGARWVLHWCAGGSTRDDSPNAGETLAWLERHRWLIGPEECRRQYAIAERKKRSRTVVIAELWSRRHGRKLERLVVFVEGDPETGTSTPRPVSPLLRHAQECAVMPHTGPSARRSRCRLGVVRDVDVVAVAA